MKRARRRRSRGWWLTLAGFVACLALAGGALYVYVRPVYYTPRSIGLVPPAAVGAAGSAPPEVTVPAPVRTSPATTHVAALGAVPIRLRLPSLGIDAPVIPEGLITKVTNDLDGAVGSLQIPTDPRVLGWWEYGAAPGAADGTVVVAGHVDTYAAGDGALFHLSSVQLGATVSLSTLAGAVSYRIVARHTYTKSALPSSVFARSGQPRLVVITCGGPFNFSTHHYADNIVVYALPTGGLSS